MEEAKRGQIVIIKNPKFEKLEGIIETVEEDRLKIYYSKEFESYAWALSEGDEIITQVHTASGIKTMNSIVIYAPSTDGELIIENANAIPMGQKREFVRAAIEFRFFIKIGERLIGATAKDISAGGIKFVPDEAVFDINDEIEIKFLEEDFGKELNVKSVIINIMGEKYIAKYIQINDYERDKLSGFCLKALSDAG